MVLLSFSRFIAQFSITTICICAENRAVVGAKARIECYRVACFVENLGRTGYSISGRNALTCASDDLPAWVIVIRIDQI